MSAQRMALRVALDLQLFHMLVESELHDLGAEQLASRSHAERALIGIMR